MTSRWTTRSALTVLLVVCVTAVAASGCSPTTDADRTRSTLALVVAVEHYLSEGSGVPERLTGGDAAAGAELVETAANATALGVTELRFRLLGVSSTSVPDGAERGAQVVDVEVTWRLADHDVATSTVVVPFLLAPDGQDVAFRTARLAGERRVPLWLLTPLAVRRTSTGLVATADRSRLEQLTSLQQRAAADVASAVPGWNGGLVVEAPATAQQFAASTGVAAVTAGTAAFAAVTTTADGRRSDDSALRIHLDPSQFWRLGPRGRRIVLGHEAAHVALGSLLHPVPGWLAEGMADHVALRRSGFRVGDSAAEALGMVRREGLPRSLPTDAQLAGSDSGAWYEAAWLAVRLLAGRYGEAALLDFYRAAGRDGGTDRAFEAVLGTTEAELVAAWRTELGRLAEANTAA